MKVSSKHGGRRRASRAALSCLLPLALGCAGPLGPGSGQAPHYAQTSWSTLHADSRNSDYAPVRVRPAQKVAWTALDGAALFVGPTIGPGGTVYVTSGRGEGTAHLHAFSPEGELLWESAPQRSLADLDYGAVINAPIVDDRGRIFAADMDQLWCFSPDGEVQWIADLRAEGVEGHFVTPVFSQEGFVGGVSTDGKVAFFDRENGGLVWPVFDLPGVGGPPSQPAPPGILGGGLLSTEFIQPMWDLIFGWRIEVANTPAVHPETGRIFITAGGATSSEGRLYGIDTSLEKGPEIAFSTAMGAGSGTSPAISPDGELVYAAGGDEVMVAVDAESGAEVWRADGVQAAASPAVGPDGQVYSFSGPEIVALDGATGEVVWRVGYDFLAAERLTPVAELEGLPSHYNPAAFGVVARIDSVLSVSRHARFGPDPSGLVWASIDLGYELPASGFVVPQAVLLTAIDARDGSVVGTTPVRDTSAALIVPDAEGRIFLTLTGTSSSMAYAVGSNFPESLRLPWVPLAGLVGLVPEN